MIYKRGRYYWLDLSINGKRIRRSLKTTKKLEAISKAADLKEELIAQYSHSKILISDFCDQYLEWAWSSKPASTPREEQRLEKIKEFFNDLEVLFLDDITPYHIEQLKAELKKTGLIKDPKKAKGVSKATVNRYLQILRNLFFKAQEWQVYSKPNPLKKVRFYKEISPREALSPAQLKKVVETVKQISKEPYSPLQKVFYDLVILAINTGMRKSEILKLKWRDVNGDEALVRGKGDKARAVPLNSQAKEVIAKQPEKSEYVFDIPNRTQQDLLRRTVNQVKKRTGIDFHFHLLRHYFTTSLVEKGVDFITISEILGHSKMTTSLIYSHTDKEKKKRAVELII